jgi:hypothetical protein
MVGKCPKLYYGVKAPARTIKKIETTQLQKIYGTSGIEYTFVLVEPSKEQYIYIYKCRYWENMMQRCIWKKKGITSVVF